VVSDARIGHRAAIARVRQDRHFDPAPEAMTASVLGWSVSGAIASVCGRHHVAERRSIVTAGTAEPVARA
jgi:hypothetical protein